MQTFGRTGITSFLTRKEDEDTGVVEDDIKKVSHYFINTLHHNTGYFLMVNIKPKSAALYKRIYLWNFSVCLLRVSQHVRNCFKYLSHRFLPRGQIYEVSVFLELKKINWVSKCNPILFQGTGPRSSITSATIEFLVWINPTLCAPCSLQ